MWVELLPAPPQVEVKRIGRVLQDPNAWRPLRLHMTGQPGVTGYTASLCSRDSLLKRATTPDTIRPESRPLSAPAWANEAIQGSSMTMRRSRACPKIYAAVVVALVACQPVRSEDMGQWSICTGPAFASDVALAAAIEDLQHDGERYGLSFRRTIEAPSSPANVILVGDAARNPATEQLLKEVDLRLKGVPDPQGYEIRTRRLDDGLFIVVAGGSLLGDVYGLYWIWDRVRVLGRIPDVDLSRSPALPIRLTEASSSKGIRNALRYTANWVSGSLVDDLVPWNSEPEATQNAAHRKELAELVDVAHAHHMKYLVCADEFSYHPTLLEEFDAELDPADPALWNALQEKYRRLLGALPKLDGVRIRTGELTRVTGTYKPFDVMHEPAECDWPLEKRYRTFLKKMHEVVVGEFDKIYFHRTWVTNTTEQHSNPAVFRRIFTDEVPTRNLYLSPYLSAGDRWYYQPYNPTFNLTPHKMIVLLSRLDYHASGGVNVFPSFPGQYYQGGLGVILANDKSNVKGAHFNVTGASSWDTGALTGYVAFRLAWEPDLDLRTIAEDFAAIHLGRDVAPEMAEILLLSHQAYKDGIYVKPVAESLSWNTLPHLRCTIFDAKAYPFVDHGKAHIEWLDPELTSLVFRNCAAQDFSPARHSLQVFGYCQDCAGSSEAEKALELGEDANLSTDS